MHARRAAPAVVAFTEVAVAGAGDRTASPGSIAAAWQAAGMASRATTPEPGSGLPMRARAREMVQASLPAAVARAAMELRGQHPGQRGVVAVTGSLHAVGAALKQLDLKE